MKTEILRLDNVSLQMSGIMQLERFNLQIFSGEIMGLMALNAHGVSSLVSLLQSNTPVHFGRVYYCEQLVNSHIYSKLGVNSYDSLKAYLDVLRRCERLEELLQGGGK